MRAIWSHSWVGITQETQVAMKEGGERTSQPSSHKSLTRLSVFTIVIYFHNICVSILNCNLSIRRSKRTKGVGKPLCFPALHFGEGCQKAVQAGSSSSWCVFDGGGRSWLPFYCATLCLIHPKLSYYSHTRVPPIIKLQLLISQCRAAAERHLSFFCCALNLFKLKSFK